MNTNETCPHCGADIAYHSISNYSRYKCGALVWGDGSTAYAECECLKRQIKQQAAEIEKLKQAIQDEREACAEVCKRLSKGRGCFVEEVLNEAVEAIKARGEVK
jgi:hypothetical protein